MSKKITLFLALFLVILACGCGKNNASKEANLKDEYNTKSDDTEQQMVVALNPQISYSDGKKYNAFADISASLEKDLNEDSMTLYQDTCWRWMYYDEGTAEWAERASVSKGAWQNCKQENTAKTPYSYSFTSDGTTALTPYNSNAVRLLSYVVATESSQGIMMSVTGQYEEGLCFIAPQDGNITISDPTGGNVSVLRRVSGILTSSLDNDKYDRSAMVIIYHNGVPIWSSDFYNPKHVGKQDELDGAYYVAFPELKDISVKQGDLISIVVDNNTDLRLPLEMIPKEYKEFVTASEVVLDEGGNYISVKGKPYLMNGIQIRPDRVIEQYSVTTEEQYTEYIEPLFKNSAELGYETIIFPIAWNQIEMIQGKYNFTLLQRYYEYAKKYDLTVQLLWFGSDVCGYNTNVPKYILKEKEVYSRLEKYPDVLDYGDMDLVEREIAAFGKLLDWLYENDKDCRTVCIQIENEPNCTAYKGPSKTSDTDEESIDEAVWVAGQKDEIYDIMNALGLMVKQGPYRCVTRVNFITFQCFYNGVRNYQLNEVAALEGIDIVGFDTYQSDSSTYLFDYLNFAGNVPHWPEYGSNHSNYVPAMLRAIAQRAGVFGYQLKSTKLDTAAPIFIETDNTWTWPTGEKSEEGTYNRVDAFELQALNIILGKASEQFALNHVDKTKVFNIKRTATCNETAEIAGVNITFTNNGAKDFGGCGYATAISDNEILIFATRGNSNFRFAGKNVTSVQAGAYIDGVWKVEQELNNSGNSISISSDMAKKGTLIRVTFN